MFSTVILVDICKLDLISKNEYNPEEKKKQEFKNSR